MDNIKFRAWFPKSELMIHFNNPHINYEYGLFALNVVEKEYEGICLLPEDYEKASFMRFTGRLDKNGKETYEGDVVKKANIIQGVIEFDDGCFVVRILWSKTMSWDKDQLMPLFKFDNYQIIGDKYSNPELTGETK
jgi:uncharacterized phage protein (TIGR01671 family)